MILSGENIADDVSTAKIADKTEGFSGSDLRQLCTAAAMCGIRELMKATSKASKADAAAKKATRRKDSTKTDSTAVKLVTEAASPSSSGDAATSSSSSFTAVGEQQPTPDSDALAERQSEPSHASTAGQADVAAASSLAQATRQTVPQQSGKENGTHVAENGHSTAGMHNNGSKRDVEALDSGSSKRLKSSSDPDTQSSHQEAVNATDGSTVSETEDSGAEQTDAVTAKDNTHEAGSGSHQIADENDENAAGSSTEQEQQLPLVASSSSTATGLQTDWLLAKLHDVAAAANQKV